MFIFRISGHTFDLGPKIGIFKEIIFNSIDLLQHVHFDNFGPRLFERASENHGYRKLNVHLKPWKWRSSLPTQNNGYIGHVHGFGTYEYNHILTKQFPRFQKVQLTFE